MPSVNPGLEVQALGVGTTNATHSEINYYGTPTGISYSMPSMGGLAAMVSYAPNMDADQIGSLGNASRDGEVTGTDGDTIEPDHPHYRHCSVGPR